MAERKVFLIGPRYSHHSGCSGYEGFSRHYGIPVKSPISVRYFSGLLGWKIDSLITRLTSRQYYSLGLLLIELSAAAHMAVHRRSLYHVIYGDTDLWLLSHLQPFLRQKLVATFHDPPWALEYIGIDEKLLRNLDGVILVSESQRPFFAKYFPKEKIFVAHHGIDTTYFHPPEDLNSSEICITIGSHLRDFETLDRAMRLIWAVRPNLRLIAVGTRRAKDPNPRFEPKIDDDRIIFMDGISDDELKAAYQSARLAIFSLKDATANNALLEAMACGLPIVATDVGGTKEYLGSEAGILCKKDDPRALADGVLRVLADAQEARRLSEASRQRALSHDYRVVAARMSEIYQHMHENDRAER